MRLPLGVEESVAMFNTMIEGGREGRVYSLLDWEEVLETQSLGDVPFVELKSSLRSGIP